MDIRLIYKLAAEQIGMKANQKGTNNPETKKLYENWKIFTKICGKMCKKVQEGYMTSPYT